ncbi:MAG: rubrerythrin family protein [Candidatus Brocadiia bacterium]|nr:MAG: rubrerythrin family protein [Candidatus Brocadiia bacterium]
MNLKGSRTEKNLITAFAGESQARNRYTYFSSKARDEGYMQVSAIFEETANQEKEHAKRLFKFLQGGQAQVMASFPAGVIATTSANLEESAEGENYETTTMYPEFAKIADEEGFSEIAGVFRKIAVAEARHRDRYLALKKNIDESRVFKKGKPVRWVCRNCGYFHDGPEAPGTCPACAHPQAYFELETANY